MTTESTQPPPRQGSPGSRAWAVAGASAPPTPPQNQSQSGRSPEPAAVSTDPVRQLRVSNAASGCQLLRRKPRSPPAPGRKVRSRAWGKARARDARRKSPPESSPAFQASPGNSISGVQWKRQWQWRRRQEAQAAKGTAPVCRAHGSQLPRRQRQRSRWPPARFLSRATATARITTTRPFRAAITPAIAADAPTKIFFFIEDLFFLAKIQEASRKLGVKVEFVKGDKEVLARITDAPEATAPALLVFDLNNAAAKPLTIIPKLKAKLKKSVSIIGFLSHLQGDLKMKATEAGCDTVMPRSAFSQSLPNLLRRYGMEEEEDNYPQPM
jgi:hypothetical protein